MRQGEERLCSAAGWIRVRQRATEAAAATAGTTSYGATQRCAHYSRTVPLSSSSQTVMD